MAAIESTSSGRLFQALFLAEAGGIPYTLEGLSRGRAINLAQKLNMYHKRWAEETGEKMKPISAKAKGEGKNSLWRLEISYSPLNGEGGGLQRVNEDIEDLLQRVREHEEERLAVRAELLAPRNISEDNPI